MAGFCRYCGKSFSDGDRFCSGCGASVSDIPNADVQKPILPQGMTVNKDGSITWFYSGQYQKQKVLYHMTSEKIGYRYLSEKKEETVGSAFKNFLLSGLAMAADSAVMNSDTYSGQDMPWDFDHNDPGMIYLEFFYIKQIKAIEKQYCIKISQNGTFKLYFEPQHYHFVLDYIIRHSPNAKLK